MTRIHVGNLFDCIRRIAQIDTIVEIPDPTTPTASFVGTETWAVSNFVIVGAGIVAALVLLFLFFLKPQQEPDSRDLADDAGEDARSQREKRNTFGRKIYYRNLAWRILSLIVAMIGFVIFLLTEDIGAGLQPIDSWTPVTAIVFAIQCLFMYAGILRSREDEAGSKKPRDVRRRAKIHFE
jgi:hypothetical protein